MRRTELNDPSPTRNKHKQTHALFVRCKSRGVVCKKQSQVGLYLFCCEGHSTYPKPCPLVDAKALRAFICHRQDPNLAVLYGFM